jgi:hypothetical protein
VLILGAEKILAGGSSAFHKTGHAGVSFLRALIGFEQEMLREGMFLSWHGSCSD